MDSDYQMLNGIRAGIEDIRSEVRGIRGSGVADLGLFVVWILLGLILWRVW